jgi:hypothetical protein
MLSENVNIVSISKRNKSQKNEATEAKEPRKTKTDVEFPGRKLLHRLWNRMREQGHTTRELSEHLGIAYPYLMALARNERPVPQISRSVHERAAAYLGVPNIQAYILSGALAPDDFFAKEPLKVELENIRDSLERHPDWGAFAPGKEDWEGLSDETQLLIAMLFERAIKQNLLSRAQMEVDEG